MEDSKTSIMGITKAIGKTSGTILKTTKLTIGLSNEESKLNSLYIEVGKKVHEIYNKNENLTHFKSFFDEKYEQIYSVQSKIYTIKNKIDIIKGVITCPKCTKQNLRTSHFCSKCGYDIALLSDTITQDIPASQEASETASIQNPQEKPKEAAKEMLKICNICGYKNNLSDKFCLSCGRIV